MTQEVWLWFGENALDWEIEAWDKLKQSNSLRGAVFLEAVTQQDFDEKGFQLKSQGWELTSVGDGSLRRVTIYAKQ